LVRPSDALVLATVTCGAGTGAAIDLWTRRVPNPLTVLLAASGVAFAAFGVSGITVTASFAGFALGLALMLPGHLFGAMGAGDVKLFAALGALIGPAPIATAFVYTALAGGVMAIVIAIRRRRLHRTLNGAAQLVASAGNTAAITRAIESPIENNRFAYAPAIAVGTLLAALGL
jgi:prepilin peptidase CpaA